jgi:hypothetical protein
MPADPNNAPRMSNALFGIAKKDAARSAIFAGLHQNCCVNDALRPVQHRFFGKRGHGGKNGLPSASGMAKISQWWRGNRRHARICGRR